MYNDESNRQNQNQGGFVRRPIPKYNGGSDKPDYQQGSQGGSVYGSGSSGSNGYGSGGYSGGGQSYSRSGSGYSGGYRGSSDRSSGGSSYSGGGDRGGYRSGGDRSGSGSSGYKSGGSYGGGYNRGSNYDRGGGNDRLVRQNDIIIKLLKDIRDRLPTPAGYSDFASSTDSYGADQSYYSSEESAFDVSGDNSDDSAPGGGRGDAANEDGFNA